MELLNNIDIPDFLAFLSMTHLLLTESVACKNIGSVEDIERAESFCLVRIGVLIIHCVQMFLL